MRGLRRLQRRIDEIEDYEERVTRAKQSFRQRNRTGDPTFRVVRSTLTRMCSGARRCGYCEDSVADEVEHIRPKDLYPEATFAWWNYLYACGPCNGPKNNQFAVFSDRIGELITVTRKQRDPVVPPEPGQMVLIDPRREDPLQFMQLDLIDTFYFVPNGEEDSREYQRAARTSGILTLNRDFLASARQEAYGHYRARLFEYVELRERGDSEAKLDKRINALRRMGHPTVWREMKRQGHLVEELRILFEQAPEAFDW